MSGRDKKKTQQQTQKCLYEILEVSRTATDDEIKKAYRKQALKWHPDRNMDRIEEANEMFKEIQRAYTVLSDPDSRAWYDNHRNAILRGESSAEPGADGDSCDGEEYDGGINLWPYFNSSCFSGFGDGENDFYNVYSEIFKDIEELEKGDTDNEYGRTSDDDNDDDGGADKDNANGYDGVDDDDGLGYDGVDDDDGLGYDGVDDDDGLGYDIDDDVTPSPQKGKGKKQQKQKKKAKGKKKKGGNGNGGKTGPTKPRTLPRFGNSKSSWDSIDSFYNFWKNFSTSRSFSNVDKYSRSMGTDRRMKRAIDKENKKIRDKCKKAFNDRVRHLAEYVFKIDPRVRTHKVEVAQQKSERERKEKERKDALERQRQEQRKNAAMYEKELDEEIERLAAETEGSGFFNPFAEYDMNRRQKKKRVNENGEEVEEDEEEGEIEEEEEDMEFYCPACDKSFKTEKQLSNHEKSKKHKENMKLLFDEVALPEEKESVTQKEQTEETAAKPGGGKKLSKKEKAKLKAQENLKQKQMEMNEEDDEEEEEEGEEEEKKEEVNDPLFCAICERRFRSALDVETHNKSKGHKAKVLEREKELAEKEKAKKAQQQPVAQSSGKNGKKAVAKKQQQKQQGGKKKGKKAVIVEEEEEEEEEEEVEVDEEEEGIDDFIQKDSDDDDDNDDDNDDEEEDDDLMFARSMAKMNQDATKANNSKFGGKKANKKMAKKPVDEEKDDDNSDGNDDNDESDTKEKAKVDTKKEQQKSKKEARKKEREAKKKKAQGLSCNTCGQEFASRNALFTHLKSTGHALRK